MPNSIDKDPQCNLQGTLNNFLILLCHSIPVNFSPAFRAGALTRSFNQDSLRVEIFNCSRNSISRSQFVSLELAKSKGWRDFVIYSHLEDQHSLLPHFIGSLSHFPHSSNHILIRRCCSDFSFCARPDMHLVYLQVYSIMSRLYK